MGEEEGISVKYYNDALKLAEKIGGRVGPRDEPVECMVRTRQDLAQLLVARMELLEVDIATLSARSGIALDSVERLVKTGEGGLHSMRSVLSALNLIPVCLPYSGTEG